jgi:hypothetical protein
MRTIHYSHYFDEGVYVGTNLEREPAINVTWIGPLGLLGFLEREMGLTGSFPDTIDRANRYSLALKKHLEVNPAAFYAGSFTTDEMGVAKDLLGWRDELVLLGWKRFAPEGQPQRLEALARVEKHFANHIFHYGVADRWQDVLAALKERPLINGFKLIVYDKPELLHPFFGQLFSILKSGVEIRDLSDNISVGENNLGIVKTLLLGKSVKGKTLKPLADDNSFALLHLKDNHYAADLIADQVRQGFRPVVISTDNKIFDYYLMDNGLPASGSKLNNSNPLIVQLFKLVSVSLAGPLNVYNLLSLLQSPYLPIPKPLAANLAKRLIEKPGINNTEWKEIIDHYFTEREKAGKDPKQLKAKRAEVDLLLDFNFHPDADVMQVKNVYALLKNWADKHSLLEIYNHSDEEKDQFAYLSRLSEALLKKLQEEHAQITSARLMKIIESIYQPATFPNQTAQAEAVERIVSPACLLGNPNSVLWLDCYNTMIKAGQYRFLSQEERDFLINLGLRLYAPEEQVKLAYEKEKRGVLAAVGQCILVTVDKQNGEEVSYHPLLSEIMTMLPGAKRVTATEDNIDVLTGFAPGFQMSHEANLPLEKLRWMINNPDKLKKRETESASSIDTLIQHPFEWVIKYKGQLNSGNSFTLPELFTLKGIIAHATTESILTQHGNDTSFALNGEFIRQQLDEKIREEGLVFLLTEMKFEYEELVRKYSFAIKSLFEIIRANNLTVIGCEFPADKEIPGIGKVAGKMDLVLHNREGKQFIFDLKWTRNNKKYQKKIDEGKDVQLAVYFALLETMPHTAFFMFDSGKLYSRHSFIGPNVVLADGKGAFSESGVLARTCNSFRYRWEELSKGEIEIGDGNKLEELAYHNDAETQNLIPLDSYQKAKSTESYSGLELFKGKIK